MLGRGEISEYRNFKSKIIVKMFTVMFLIYLLFNIFLNQVFNSIGKTELRKQCMVGLSKKEWDIGLSAEAVTKEAMVGLPQARG